MKTIRLTGALLALIVLLGGMSAVQGEENVTAYEAYLAGGEAPCLAKRYEGIFTVGAAVSPPLWPFRRCAAFPDAAGPAAPALRAAALTCRAWARRLLSSSSRRLFSSPDRASVPASVSMPQSFFAIPFRGARLPSPFL